MNEAKTQSKDEAGRKHFRMITVQGGLGVVITHFWMFAENRETWQKDYLWVFPS